MFPAHWQLSRALNLSDKCRLSLPAAAQAGAWAVGRVGYVNTISETKVSGNPKLSDKIMILLLPVKSKSLPSTSFPIL